mgnify:CR=1 FL=1
MPFLKLQFNYLYRIRFDSYFAQTGMHDKSGCTARPDNCVAVPFSNFLFCTQLVIFQITFINMFQDTEISAVYTAVFAERLHIETQYWRPAKTRLHTRTTAWETNQKSAKRSSRQTQKTQTWVLPSSHVNWSMSFVLESHPDYLSLKLWWRGQWPYAHVKIRWLTSLKGSYAMVACRA